MLWVGGYDDHFGSTLSGLGAGVSGGNEESGPVIGGLWFGSDQGVRLTHFTRITRVKITERHPAKTKIIIFPIRMIYTFNENLF